MDKLLIKTFVDILYEDNHCLAVEKAPGELTEGDKSGDPSLFESVKVFLKTRDGKKGNTFLGIVHRLDRPVGGVMVFAKTSKGASRLSEQFRNHTVEKIYWAVVEGVPKSPSGAVRQFLTKDEFNNIVTAHETMVPGARMAETAYRVLQTDGAHALVEIILKTGRSHQIRVAMQSLGTPILGDIKYGARRELPESRGKIALLARSLAFDQAVTLERVKVVATSELACFLAFQNI